MSTMELLSNSVSAALLSELLTGKTEEQWMLWLNNNRNQSRRVPYRLPFERMAGGVFYLDRKSTRLNSSH